MSPFGPWAQPRADGAVDAPHGRLAHDLPARHPWPLDEVERIAI